MQKKKKRIQMIAERFYYLNSRLFSKQAMHNKFPMYIRPFEKVSENKYKNNL